jgi:hypothetical protein
MENIILCLASWLIFVVVVVTVIVVLNFVRDTSNFRVSCDILLNFRNWRNRLLPSSDYRCFE